MKCIVFSQNELKKKGFGGITAVGKGSKNEPKLMVLEHHGGRSNKKPIVLVGKAVTFDTGGISLKPGEKMDEMKFDKCGGCTVLGIMKAVSELKLPVNVVGIIPSVENMPSGESYRPGDIIKLYNGKTAEILNTDAEGRLILADALAYGEKQYSPKAIIDFATLTGACIVALGTNVAAIVSNNEKLKQKINESSKRTTEEVWELPLNDDYMDMIKSDVADMKNVGIGRAAGTITAAAFLKNAIEETPWVHIDIAGVAWTQVATKSKPYNPKGATGFGVRLILDYLQKI
jgi:leucyl aminopeptidase